jgi:hypothetical protein
VYDEMVRMGEAGSGEGGLPNSNGAADQEVIASRWRSETGMPALLFERKKDVLQSLQRRYTGKSKWGRSKCIEIVIKRVSLPF